MTLQIEDRAELLKIDVERRTTRGRVCPRCGGKIIPSRRAVYQSSGDPNQVFPAWQCERCGYEELVAKAIKPAAKHGEGAKSSTARTEQKPTAAASSSAASTVSDSRTSTVRVVPALKDRKGRALPPDVNRMMAEMFRKEDQPEP